jgi:stage V sporulation protein B
MSYAKKAVQGVILVFAINIIAAFFGYLIRLALARKLTVEDYGLFFAIFTLINFIAIFRDLGLGHALVKFIPEFSVKSSNSMIKSSVLIVMSIHLFMAFLISAILYFFADFLAAHYFKNGKSSVILLFFLIFFILSIFRDILRNLFQGFQKMLYFSLMYLTENILLLGSLLYMFTMFSADIKTAIFSYLLTYFLIIVIFSFVSFKIFSFFKEKFLFSKQLAKKLLKFGFFVTIGGVSGMVLLYTDTLILTYFRTLKEVGIYNVVVPTVMLLNFFGVSIIQVIYPMFSELSSINDKVNMQNLLSAVYKYLFIILIPVSFIMLSFPGLILKTLFGEQYISGALALQILVIGLLFLTMYTINSGIFDALNRPEIASKILLLGALLNFGLNLVVIPAFGIAGAALTSTLSYLVIFLISSFKIRDFVNVKIPWLSWLKIVFSGGIFILIIAFLKKLLTLNPLVEAGISIFIAGLAYLSLIYLFKIVSVQEIKEIAKKAFN